MRSRALAADPLVERVAQLERQVAELLARHGPRDAADAALLPAIAEAVQGRTFTARALWRHRRVDAALAGALLAADVDSARSLGHVLRRLAHSPGPIRLVRLDASREGWRWRCEFCEL